MSNEAQQLVDRCADMYAAAGDAIEWIDDVRSTSQRLDSDSEGLILKLRKVRNLVRRLGRAASRPMSVGFFGISQAGKSYLISALAAGANGHLETQLDERRLDFIEHVDPGGKGGEATGLVTRFTRRPVDAPRGHPIQLTLFSEVDLIKVLGNAFFNDFDHTKLAYDNDPASVRSKVLSDLEKRRRQQPVPGIDADDVVDLMEYFRKRFPNLMAPLLGDYWPSAIDLAPNLLPADRAQLFSVLWGGIGEMSEAYLMLCGALEKLGHAEFCYCPLGVLVNETESGGLSKSQSIMSVDILDRLGKDHADLIEVVPVAADGSMAEVCGVPRSLLAALTTELRFVLAEPPAASTVENVDLLDFPGYRGRLNVTDISQVSDDAESEGSAIAQLILRGKVACLFERYTDDQEMNVLVLCTPSDKQSDVNDIGPVLDTWINATQGEKPEKREHRLPGLAWAMTRFDMRIDSMLQDSRENTEVAWAKMMKMVLERFKQFEWIDDWGPSQPFSNTYVVRKPKMVTKWLTLDGEDETDIAGNWQGQVELLKETFIADPTVQKHFADPGLAWDAMVRLNDGGITRLAEYLAGAARIEVKLERIREQLDDETREVAEQRLGAYFQKEGAAEVEQKQAVIKAVTGDLRTPKKLARFGELLKALQPSLEQLRARYLRLGETKPETTDNAAAEDAAADEDDHDALFGLDDLVVLPGGGESTDSPAVTSVSTGAAQFAKAAMRDWTSQLRGLSDNADLMHFLAADPKIVQSLTDELITGANRLRVESRIIEDIQEAEERTAATRGSLVERQVMTAANCINDFVDYLGMSTIAVAERPVSTVAAKHHVFEPPAAVAVDKLPQLPPKPINFSGLFIVDWLDAFGRLAVDNAGHSAGREITPEQNERLGTILAQMKRGAAISAA
ncbi:MAG: putative virulence factor [Gammaproteobacteria bacterium]|nr:putative virulence factor [Gammaproteobacteria bacterium]